MRYCVAYKCRAVAHFFCYMHLWDIHGVALSFFMEMKLLPPRERPWCHNHLCRACFYPPLPVNLFLLYQTIIGCIYAADDCFIYIVDISYLLRLPIME